MSDEMPPIINVDENITGVSSHDIDGKKTITGQSMREHVEANWPYKYIRADLHRAEIANEFCLAIIERTNKIIKSGEISSIADDIYEKARTRATREILQEWQQNEL